MDLAGASKADWRLRLEAARAQGFGSPGKVDDAEGGLAGAPGLGFAPGLGDAPDLADAPGLEGVLPAAGEWVAAYASFGTEVPTTGLLANLAARELGLLLPAPGDKRDRLAWGEVTARTCALPVTEPGKLPQPPPPWLSPQALARCQLVLVPALAVDRSGTRLGRGGGWYDRALAYARPDALVLAVVYPDELFPAGALPCESHDQPVDGALTPLGVELFPGRTPGAE
jgi:5-formyltetrahydrofolate cyclo-ligase